MLVGGIAAIVHGVVRLTEDLDIVYRRFTLPMSPNKPYFAALPPTFPSTGNYGCGRSGILLENPAINR